VELTRILHSDFGHYEWLITFVESTHELPLGGDNLELLVGDGASLGGTDVNLTVAAVSDGSAFLDGDLQFCFRILDGKKDMCTLDLTMGSPGAEGQRVLNYVATEHDSGPGMFLMEKRVEYDTVEWDVHFQDHGVTWYPSPCPGHGTYDLSMWKLWS
jgi:hypothetical protein